MKKIFKWAAYLLLTLALLAAIAASYIHVKGVPTYQYNPPSEIVNLKVPLDSNYIARGKKIAALLCSECHRDFETGKLTGHLMTDLPAEFGAVASMNITQDTAVGIGKWTDGELYYYLRTSVRKDGHYNPIMGGMSRLSEEDIHAIIAWLRSDDPVLAADTREYPPNKPNFLIKLLTNTVFTPPALPATKVPMPDTANQIALGRYLADDLCSCFACHSADFKTMDNQNPSKSSGYYGGGNPMLNYDGETVRSANITMDRETGIGSWTKAQFRDAVRFNLGPRGPLNYPMFPHSSLTESEVDAIWAFLQTVPPINNRVERYRQ